METRHIGIPAIQQETEAPAPTANGQSEGYRHTLHLKGCRPRNPPSLWRGQKISATRTLLTARCSQYGSGSRRAWRNSLAVSTTGQQRYTKRVPSAVQAMTLIQRRTMSPQGGFLDGESWLDAFLLGMGAPSLPLAGKGNRVQSGLQAGNSWWRLPPLRGAWQGGGVGGGEVRPCAAGACAESGASQLLGKPDDDALGAANVAEAVDVLVLGDFPDQFGAMGV